MAMQGTGRTVGRFVSRFLIGSVVVASAIAITATNAYAQAAASSTIHGVASDETGAALPGEAPASGPKPSTPSRSTIAWRR